MHPVLIDSFLFLNRPERKARNRYATQLLLIYYLIINTLLLTFVVSIDNL